MGYHSPAAQLLRLAQRLQIEDLKSNAEDEVSSSPRALGVPQSWLEDDDCSDTSSSSDADEHLNNCIQQLSLQSKSSDLAASVHHQQQVCSFSVVHLSCLHTLTAGMVNADGAAVQIRHSALQIPSSRLCRGMGPSGHCR